MVGSQSHKETNQTLSVHQDLDNNFEIATLHKGTLCILFKAFLVYIPLLQQLILIQYIIKTDHLCTENTKDAVCTIEASSFQSLE